MGLDYKIEKEPSVISVTVRGNIDYLSLDCMWKDIAAACRKHRCTDILGVAEIEAPTSGDAYDHASILALAGLNADYRIAWVESNPQSRDTARLAEVVIRNRGLATGCLFDNVADARHWLAESRLS